MQITTCNSLCFCNPPEVEKQCRTDNGSYCTECEEATMNGSDIFRTEKIRLISWEYRKYSAHNRQGEYSTAAESAQIVGSIRSCTLYSVESAVYMVHVQCRECSIHCTLYSVLCTVYRVSIHAQCRYTVYCVQCTMYSVQCTCIMYSVQCTVYSVQKTEIRTSVSLNLRIIRKENIENKNKLVNIKFS